MTYNNLQFKQFEIYNMSTIELDATKATLARKILNETNHFPKPAFGCMKGTFTWMSDDFNAPLEDFKDYM
ncbi:hypothetical protein AGMMS4956_14060 [Bacteroidia bacterium]|nr:hypothetical protein AGMMS4956_14060 [Bacteroidia bacterium]